MIQAIRRRRVSDHLLLRAVSASIVLALWVLISSCANLAKVSDQTIPKMILPLTDADFNGLVAQLQPLMNLQSLRSPHVRLGFIDAESSERYREADAVLAFKRLDHIRLLIQAPLTKTKIAEMVSDAEHFKVAIYPNQYKHFLIGTNNADYGKWREKLGRTQQQSALINVRPFHFTDALMIRPLHVGEARFVYSLEEALVEEPDTQKGAKKGARLLRSFYVISESELPSADPGPARVRRRFWFDRTEQARLARQQLFDEHSLLATEVYYSGSMKLNAASTERWPSTIFVARPRDNYSVRLTFLEEGMEFNPNLPERIFVLENTDGLPETNLDKVEGSLELGSQTTRR